MLAALLLVLPVAEAGPALDEIIAIVEKREAAMSAFAVRYHETKDGRRFGPKSFAWRSDRSLYRGPKAGEPHFLLAWLQGGKTTRLESLYYRDREQAVWLHRYLQPVPLLWDGTRRESRGPDLRDETGLHLGDRPLSVLFRERAIRNEGEEPVDGRPCVKLVVCGPFPYVLFLSEEFDFYPARIVHHNIGSSRRPEVRDALRMGNDWYYPTRVYEWRRMQRRGDACYPLEIRIRSVGFEENRERLIEIVPESVRFGDEVTEEDFALPPLYFARDSIEEGHALFTPAGRIPLGWGLAAVAILAAVPGVLLLRARRRRPRGP